MDFIDADCPQCRTRSALVVGVSFERLRPDTLPDAIAAPGETIVLTLHAEGAQIYECKAGADGKLAWAFREPTAALLLDGKTVGRHYAGPNWEHIDSSAVVGKAVGNAPGATANDIPWLKLTVTSGARHRHPLRRHDGAADQYGRRQTRRRLRQARHLSQRALLGGLRVPAQGLTPLRPEGPMLFMVIERFKNRTRSRSTGAFAIPASNSRKD
jgi:hypothetical protein